MDCLFFCFFVLFFEVLQVNTARLCQLTAQTASPIFQSVTNLATLHNCKISPVLSHQWPRPNSLKTKIFFIHSLFSSTLKQQRYKLFVASPQRMQEQTAFVSLLSDFVSAFSERTQVLVSAFFGIYLWSVQLAHFPLHFVYFHIQSDLQTWVSVDERVSLCCC